MGNIIFPTGKDLIDCLNQGDAICNNCGAIMERTSDPNGGCDIYICPACGTKVDEMEYEYEGHDGWAPGSGMDENSAPVGCLACGGPYPYCTTSCQLFND